MQFNLISIGLADARTTAATGGELHHHHHHQQQQQQQQQEMWAAAAAAAASNPFMAMRHLPGFFPAHPAAAMYQAAAQWNSQQWLPHHWPATMFNPTILTQQQTIAATVVEHQQQSPPLSTSPARSSTSSSSSSSSVLPNGAADDSSPPESPLPTSLDLRVKLTSDWVHLNVVFCVVLLLCNSYIITRWSNQCFVNVPLDVLLLCVRVI